MVKNGYKKYKTGFSLLEAMVVMVIVAIFVAVIANSIPHKSKLAQRFLPRRRR